jgi:hypothetical protein
VTDDDVLRPAAGGGTWGDAPQGPATNQVLALVVAVVLAVAGVAGFVVTGASDWTASHPGHRVLGLGVNPLHNAVHLAVGVAGLLLWRRPGGARGYGLLLAVGWTALLVYGLLATGASWDVLAVNGNDTVLHGVLVVLGLVVALWPRRRPGRHRADPTEVLAPPVESGVPRSVEAPHGRPAGPGRPV